jgi:predicted RNase H-like HicB family nuclease
LFHPKSGAKMSKVELVRIEANLQWQCSPAGGEYWVGVCDPLKLTVQANTYAELLEDIGHTLDAMFKDLLETRELERFLRDHGWTPIGPIPRTSKNVRFDIPFIPVPLMKVPHGQKAFLHQ